MAAPIKPLRIVPPLTDEEWTRLRPHERRVLGLRRGDTAPPMTLAAIAEVLGVTPGYVWQIQRDALRKLGRYEKGTR